MVWHPNVVLYNTLDESLGDSDDAHVKIRNVAFENFHGLHP